MQSRHILLSLPHHGHLRFLLTIYLRAFDPPLQLRYYLSHGKWPSMDQGAHRDRRSRFRAGTAPCCAGHLMFYFGTRRTGTWHLFDPRAGSVTMCIFIFPPSPMLVTILIASFLSFSGTTFMLDRYYHPESVALYTIVPALAAASKIVIRYMGVMLGTTHMFLFGLMLVNDDTLLSNSKTNPIRRALYFPMQFSGFNHIAPSHDYWLAVFKAAGVERASTFDVSSDLLPGQPVPSPGGPKPHASSINTATMPKEP
ncbi:hypothetical protein C8R43DRAFT_978690 [Mycena crocata]|nr:hypothetical protein C8R43DRAFT_978690 [Mycena crocata]